MLDCNTIIEMKNAEFFEHIFPLKIDVISHVPIENIFENSSEELRRSKRQIQETTFGNDFYTYLVEIDHLAYSDAISSSNSLFWKEAIKTEIDFIEQIKLGF